MKAKLSSVEISIIGRKLNTPEISALDDRMLKEQSRTRVEANVDHEALMRCCLSFG